MAAIGLKRSQSVGLMERDGKAMERENKDCFGKQGFFWSLSGTRKADAMSTHRSG